jgi:carbonic anhydrase
MSFIKDYPSLIDRINLIKKQPSINTASPNKHILYCNSSGGRCDLNINYKTYDEKNPGKITVQNTGNYSIIINDGSFLTFNGFSLNGIVSDKYYLNEIVFFTPSKNINLNKVYDLEANFIHISEDNQRCLVISLFIIVNDSDEFKRKKYYQMARKLSIDNNFPENKNSAKELNVKNWNFQDLFPDNKSFFNTILNNGNIGMIFMKNPIEVPQLFITKIINIMGLKNFTTEKNNLIKNPPINPPDVQLFYSENIPPSPLGYECESNCEIKSVDYIEVNDKSNIVVETFANNTAKMIDDEPDIIGAKEVDTTKNLPITPVKLESKVSKQSATQPKPQTASGPTTPVRPVPLPGNSSKLSYKGNNLADLTAGFGTFGTAFVYSFILLYIFVIIFILYTSLINTNISKKKLIWGITFIIIGIIFCAISLFYIFEKNKKWNDKDEIDEDKYQNYILGFGIPGIIFTMFGIIILVTGLFGYEISLDEITIKEYFRNMLFITIMSVIFALLFIFIGSFLLYQNNISVGVPLLVIGIILLLISFYLIYKYLREKMISKGKGLNTAYARGLKNEENEGNDFGESKVLSSEPILYDANGNPIKGKLEGSNQYSYSSKKAKELKTKNGKKVPFVNLATSKHTFVRNPSLATLPSAAITPVGDEQTATSGRYLNRGRGVRPLGEPSSAAITHVVEQPIEEYKTNGNNVINSGRKLLNRSPSIYEFKNIGPPITKKRGQSSASYVLPKK